MSFTIPPSFTAAIKALLIGAGDVLTFTPATGAVISGIRGSIQRPGTQTLIGDAIQEGYLVYVPGDAFGSVVPEKFDRLTIDGEQRSISEALRLQAGGVTHAWQITCLG